MNIKFPYNNAFIAVVRSRGKYADMSQIHLKCLIWLDENLEVDDDYKWGSKEKTCIVNEFLYFKKEEDLLAFRLACGV